MRRVHPFVVPCFLLVLLAACSPEPKVPEWKLLATDPPAEATLGRQQPFHVQFEIRSRGPVTVTLAPRYRGEDVINGLATQAGVAVPAGGGRAVTSFFFWAQTPTRVDELLFTVTAPDQPPQRFSAPVNLTWRADPQPAAPPAAWVLEWQKTRPPPPAGKAPQQQ